MFRTVLPIEAHTHFLASVPVVQTALNMQHAYVASSNERNHAWNHTLFELSLFCNRMHCSLKMASKLSVSYNYFLLNGCSKEDLILFNLTAVKIYYMVCEKLDPGTDSIVWNMTTQILHRCYLLCQDSVWPSSSYSHKLPLSTLSNLDCIQMSTWLLLEHQILLLNTTLLTL
jgi:hypothetical protein